LNSAQIGFIGISLGRKLQHQHSSSIGQHWSTGFLVS
jgi:hypothetical protein